MALETNLNVSPYFDDFDSKKDFYKVLFQPGVAVQARELNQLQSILQNQIFEVVWFIRDIDEFHPCQLEKRFGGDCDTPTNFWPPYVGKEFTPIKRKDEKFRDIFNDEDYKKILIENPLLQKHPDFLEIGESSRDFRSSKEIQKPVELEPIIQQEKKVIEDLPVVAPKV